MNYNIQPNLNKITFNIINIYFKNENYNEIICIRASPNEKISELIDRYKAKINSDFNTYNYLFQNKILDFSLTLSEAGLTNNSEILVTHNYDKQKDNNIYKKESNKSENNEIYSKEINIKFLKISNNYYNKIVEFQLVGLLKLCLLKEISSILNDDRCKKLDELIYFILKILANGYVYQDNTKENIKEILKNIKGSNIINFSNFIDENINKHHIKSIINLLNKNEFLRINDTLFHLSKYNKYMKFFNDEFEKAKKESIFEFSMISLVIIEREDFEKFESERDKCLNRVDRILYHGTNIEPISNILTGLYRRSIERKKAINGKGVYFTDSLDYGWYYGGEAGNRANFFGIPKIGDTFTVIINLVYYDKNGFKQIKDSKDSNRTPGKNQINFAYAGAKSERLSEPDVNKFFGTEFVIYELDQICPFMSAKLRREEFCVIWRDVNFSSKPVYNNEFDEEFKKFLKERIKYINQNAKYNIYPCETSQEALELVKKKKYNKIILISNVGTDLGGKKFIDQSREIIGNDVITLFLAYNISHLNWIKNYKNALFSNNPKFYEEYLQSFEGYNKKENLKSLIKKIEEHYKVKFNFDETFLDYPHFREEGTYGDLIFDK